MSRMTLDLNTLAQETLELSENIRANMGKEFLEAHQGEFVFDENWENKWDETSGGIQEESIPEAPGLFYKLEKGISTFCLRGAVSEDLSYDMEILESGEGELSQKLKLTGDEDHEHIGFFACKDLAIAETIYDQMINRRFPRQEAMLCNLSDPGFSWWMDKGPLGFKVYFQSHGIERDDSLLQLGPLGDPMIAARRLSRSLSYLKNLFPVNEFSATDKSFMVSTTPSAQAKMEKFFLLFETGEDSLLSEDLIQNDPTFSLYLREIAALRRFWLQATVDCF